MKGNRNHGGQCSFSLQTSEPMFHENTLEGVRVSIKTSHPVVKCCIRSSLSVHPSSYRAKCLEIEDKSSRSNDWIHRDVPNGTQPPLHPAGLWEQVWTAPSWRDSVLVTAIWSFCCDEFLLFVSYWKSIHTWLNASRMQQKGKQNEFKIKTHVKWQNVKIINGEY